MLDLCVREQSTTVGEAWLLLYDLSTHIDSIVKKKEREGKRQKEGRGVGMVGRRDLVFHLFLLCIQSGHQPMGWCNSHLEWLIYLD